MDVLNYIEFLYIDERIENEQMTWDIYLLRARRNGTYVQSVKWGCEDLKLSK